MVFDESGFLMKVVFDENVFDEIDHFHPNFDESEPDRQSGTGCFLAYEFGSVPTLLLSKVRGMASRQCLRRLRNEVVVPPVPEVVPEAAEGEADLRRRRRSETLCVWRSGWFPFVKTRSMRWPS